MSIRPSVPEIITVNSEPLQKTVRDLLPSQAGFGSELQASNVITPIIDLTPTAEGSVLRQDLQTCYSYGSLTAISATSGTVNLATTPGFNRVRGTVVVNCSASATANVTIDLFDCATPISILDFRKNGAGSVAAVINEQFDFMVFLDSDTICRASIAGACFIQSTTQQIATLTGDLIDPAGFVRE